MRKQTVTNCDQMSLKLIRYRQCHARFLWRLAFLLAAALPGCHDKLFRAGEVTAILAAVTVTSYRLSSSFTPGTMSPVSDISPVLPATASGRLRPSGQRLGTLGSPNDFTQYVRWRNLK